MTRKLWVLGLNLAALAATGAVAASIASATVEFHSEEAITELHGEQIAVYTIATTVGTIKCKKVTWTGTRTVKTSPELTLTSDDSECTAFGQKAVPTTNGCDWRFTEQKVNPPSAKVKIECPEDQDPVFDVPTSNCSVTIEPNQEPNGAVDYINEGAGANRDLRVLLTLKDVKTVVIGPGLICGTAGTQEDSTITGSFTLKAFVDPMPSSQVGLWVE